MNIYPDIRTVLFFASLIGLVVSLTFVYVLKTRKTYEGFQFWMIASLSSFFGVLLVSLRGLIPDIFSIVLGGTLIASFMVYIAYGINLFIGRAAKKGLYLIPVGLTAVAQAYFTYIYPSVNARTIVISIVIAVLDLWCAALVYRGVSRKMGGPCLFLIAAFMISAGLNVIRFIWVALVDPYLSDFMSSAGLHGILLIIITGIHLAVAVGLILLNFQRVEQDLKDSLDEIKVLRGIIPICASCKKVRDDKGYWNQIESYIRDRSEAEFTHGICPDCVEKLYPGYTEGMQNKKAR